MAVICLLTVFLFSSHGIPSESINSTIGSPSLLNALYILRCSSSLPNNLLLKKTSLWFFKSHFPRLTARAFSVFMIYYLLLPLVRAFNSLSYMLYTLGAKPCLRPILGVCFSLGYPIPNFIPLMHVFPPHFFVYALVAVLRVSRLSPMQSPIDCLIKSPQK
ncbi:hypothetical protein SAMN05216587_11825 [Selenomonas ruminantium]|uniref:Uncharacterized protein n=1 Tax=Selenomonas ruminantium TaxID=971 RepID=A0A1I0YS18_SELRU|nr:hypothetical protein SAMN05216587_11825 [Selenomonas ruminantium]